MKRVFLFVFLLLIVGFGFAQSIDRAIYEETTLFDFILWNRRSVQSFGGRGETKKFKATVLFTRQSGTILSFTDLDNQNQTMFDIDRRWPAMNRNQQVTIYFTATANGLNSPGGDRIIDDIDIDFD